MQEEQGAKRRPRSGDAGPRAASAGAGASRSGGSRVRRRTDPRAPATHVDHRRGTGKVRGVPCSSRHAALGQFKDRPDATRRAAAYVEGIAWKPTLAAPGVYLLPS
ncbi:hypothetical protein GCM10019016_139410 [Streptomyces prasinosporus]|uniref:Uncharacterized protein n=1 Tax=Streptomyces prasinosporus TaxID=68256 RepID=A0ABP6UGG3_9ACTN